MGFLTTGCRWDPNYCCACIKKTTTQPEIRGGVDAHPFVSFPFISCSLCFASLCFVSFGHSLTHQFVRQFICCFISIVVVSSLPLSPVTSTTYYQWQTLTWSGEAKIQIIVFVLQQYLSILHKDNKHPTTMKHAIGKFNIGHNFLRLFGFLIVQTSKGVQRFFPASCCYLCKWKAFLPVMTFWGVPK